jgi:LPS O-antigen subunit length determinant protein (WzzB/FepE family)
MTEQPSRQRGATQDDPVLPSGDAELGRLLRDVWASRGLVILLTTAFLLAGIAYAFMGTKWYRAEVLLVPQEDEAQGRLLGGLGGLGGLASLAGINLGGGKDVEPLAVLKSRAFAREFIAEQNLMQVLLADEWDPASRTWRGPEHQWPDERDAIKVFDEDVRHIVEDKKTGLITLAVEWTDPKLASRWAMLMVERLNAQMRSRAMSEAEANIKFLRAEVTASGVSTLQQSASKLLEIELQKVMLARGKVQYAFRVVDPASPPKKPVRPQRWVVIAVAPLLGLLAAVFIVVVRRALRAASLV